MLRVNKVNTSAARILDKLKIPPVATNSNRKGYSACPDNQKPVVVHLPPLEFPFETAFFDPDSDNFRNVIGTQTGKVLLTSTRHSCVTLFTEVKFPCPGLSDELLKMPSKTREKVATFLKSQYRQDILDNNKYTLEVRHFVEEILDPYIKLLNRTRRTPIQSKKLSDLAHQWERFLFRKG